MKDDLLQGQVIVFENEIECLSLELSYESTFGHQMAYKTFFNGAYTMVTKSFKSIEKEANRLIDKYNLIKTE